MVKNTTRYRQLNFVLTCDRLNNLCMSIEFEKWLLYSCKK